MATQFKYYNSDAAVTDRKTPISVTAGWCDTHDPDGGDFVALYKHDYWSGAASISMTPGEARKLAGSLLDAADAVGEVSL